MLPPSSLVPLHEGGLIGLLLGALREHMLTVRAQRAQETNQASLHSTG